MLNYINRWGADAARRAQQPRWLLVCFAIIMVVVIGLLDYITGYEVSFFPFYSIPVLFILWFYSERAAIWVSLLSAISWWVADLAAGHQYSTEWYRIWDMIVRMMFFTLVVLAGSGFRQYRDANRARIELLERSRKLEQQIASVSENERQRIGRDLHDDLGQYLVALGFAAEALKKELEAKGSPGVLAAGTIADQINLAVIRTRNFARGISPVDSTSGGLVLALEQLVHSAATLSKISCTFICDHDVALRDNTDAVHLYRLAQEALNNAMKHGHTKNIIVALEAEEGNLSLRVSDDGVGFDPKNVRGNGMGLETMQYRASIIGGVLEIQPNTPTGTVVSCTIDMNAKADSNAQGDSHG